MVVIVVDAGSGYSRLLRYTQGDGDGLVRVDGQKELEGVQPLHEVLGAPDHSLRRQWARVLSQMIVPEDGPRPRVFVGGTAGVRDAIAAGKIQRTAIQELRQLLVDEVSPRASLDVLSGSAEATFELEAVQYCLSKAFPTLGAAKCGLLSGGGMSSQVACGDLVVSLDTRQKVEGHSAILEQGVEQGLVSYATYLRSAICDRLRDLTGGAAKDATVALGGDGHVFAAIEMLGSVGQNAGIGGRLVTVAEATAALEQHLEAWKAQGHDQAATGTPLAGWTWKDAVPGASAAQALALLSCLHAGSLLVFAQKFELAEGHLLKPSWSLGQAIHLLPPRSNNIGGKDSHTVDSDCQDCVDILEN